MTITDGGIAGSFAALPGRAASRVFVTPDQYGGQEDPETKAGAMRQCPTMAGAAPDDLRFSTPLYSITEAARYVGVPPTTFSTWARGYTKRRANRKPVTGEPIVTAFETEKPGRPAIPFIGLVEGMVLTAIRRSGVSLQRIRPALRALEEEIGLEHALASKALYTDGAEVLYDYSQRDSDSPASAGALALVVVRNGQRVFTEIIEEYLRRIEYAADGFAQLVHLPQYERNEVVVDPRRSFGKPIFLHGGVRVDDVLQRFWAGERLDELTEEFGVPGEDLEDAIRVASRHAA